jgi:hypothetical protein
VKRAEILARPKTPRVSEPKADGKKPTKGAAATREAKPEQVRLERAKRKAAQEAGFDTSDGEQDAPQSNEAGTEDTE